MVFNKNIGSIYLGKNSGTLIFMNDFSYITNWYGANPKENKISIRVEITNPLAKRLKLLSPNSMLKGIKPKSKHLFPPRI